MRYLFASLLFVLAACAPASPDLASGTVINVDDQPVRVAWQEGRRFAASGGGERSDSWTSYRQKRAIEVLSGCRVEKVLSGTGDPVLVAEVNCSHPRRSLTLG